MNPSERILHLAGFAKELIAALDKVALEIERSAEATNLGLVDPAEALGRLQLVLHPEALVKQLGERRQELAILLLQYEARQTKNRLAREYQRRKRITRSYQGGN